MCTSPIIIKNKKFPSLYVRTRNSYIKVPCGRCDECLRKRAKDLFVRAKYEAEKTYLNGGCGFFTTLTYGTQLAPTLEHLGQNYYVFNKKHVIDFVKRLRTNLDRYFLKYYHTLSPNFKYLITAEFGTSAGGYHLPHYHPIFLFEENISLAAFRRCFIQSLVNRRDNKRIFGKIFLCEPLDIKQGGIKYACKYILKDQKYETTNKIILDRIKFETDRVNSRHGILPFPITEEDYFYNKAIRSTKAYKKDIASSVGPYRNMLQFYMCSNDFGCSAIVDRYGENLFTLGLLNIDGLPYSIPKQVIQRLERTQGSDKRDIIAKAVFVSMFEKCVSECIDRNFITPYYGALLKDFVVKFIQPRFGSLYFVSPFSADYWNLISTSPLRDYDDLFNECEFYEDNNFYKYRNAVYSVIDFCNSKEALNFRAALAMRKNEKEKKEYEDKKRNKSYVVF